VQHKRCFLAVTCDTLSLRFDLALQEEMETDAEELFDIAEIKLTIG
jgi:hypothetical protein